MNMYETPQGPLGVYAAISAVSAAMSKVGIGKTRQNKDQGFNFRGIDDVLNALSPLYADHGLVIVPKVLERVLVQSTTKSGSPLWKVTVKVEYHVIAVKDGSREIAVTYGEAMDSADKATNKALSAAYKYLAIQLFAIPIEGTPDADYDTPQEEAHITPQQVAEIKAKLQGGQLDEKALLAYVSEKAGHEVLSIELVPAAAFVPLLAKIDKALTQRAAAAAATAGVAQGEPPAAQPEQQPAQRTPVGRTRTRAESQPTGA